MPRIDPSVLKALREAKKLSLDELAERTGITGAPKIDRGTIWRIEQGKGANTRHRTVQQLARALNTDPSVLLGETERPEVDDDNRYSDLKKLSFPISTRTHNALYLLNERYGVTYSEILELAPFLYCWAAEASLQQRRTRLEKAETAFKSAQEVEANIEHMNPADMTNLEEKLAFERRSIECQDIFCMADEEWGCWDYTGTENPFAKFLDELAQSVPAISFEACPWRDFPEYEICREEAERIAGGDRDLAEAILRGHVFLGEMPKEIQDIGKRREQTEWVRQKADEYRQRLISIIRHAQVEEATP